MDGTTDDDCYISRKEFDARFQDILNKVHALERIVDQMVVCTKPVSWSDSDHSNNHTKATSAAQGLYLRYNQFSSPSHATRTSLLSEDRVSSSVPWSSVVDRIRALIQKADFKDMTKIESNVIRQPRRTYQCYAKKISDLQYKNLRFGMSSWLLGFYNNDGDDNGSPPLQIRWGKPSAVKNDDDDLTFTCTIPPRSFRFAFDLENNGDGVSTSPDGMTRGYALWFDKSPFSSFQIKHSSHDNYYAIYMWTDPVLENVFTFSLTGVKRGLTYVYESGEFKTKTRDGDDDHDPISLPCFTAPWWLDGKCFSYR